MRFVPSGRSLLVSFGILVAVGAAYLLAYATPVFAVDRVDVRGAPPQLTRQVEAATQQFVGRSLVGVDPADVRGKILTIPGVAGVSVDRAFPSTLIVRVRSERALTVIRQGPSSWVATGDGAIFRRIETGTLRGLPRLWVGRGATIRVGGFVPAGLRSSIRTLAAAHSVAFPRSIKGVRVDGDGLTLVLRRGPEIRLGRPVAIALKVAIAGKVLRMVDDGVQYVDVSVPERPVAGP